MVEGCRFFAGRFLGRVPEVRKREGARRVRKRKRQVEEREDDEEDKGVSWSDSTSKKVDFRLHLV